MRKMLGVGVLVALCFCATQSLVFADTDDDAEPASIDWSTITQTYPMTVANGEDRPSTWMVKRLYASDEGTLIATHVQTDRGDKLPHYHFEKDFGDAGVPTVAQANRYWDWCFGIVQYEEAKTARDPQSNATNVQNCSSYAFDEKADSDETHTVAYNYWSNYTYNPFHHDFVQVSPVTDVEAGDLLSHVNHLGGCVHVSIVDEVETYAENPTRRRPTQVRWKWAHSGVYTYSPPAANAFDQPYNLCLDWTKTFAAQPGRWEPKTIYATEVWEDD